MKRENRVKAKEKEAAEAEKQKEKQRLEREAKDAEMRKNRSMGYSPKRRTERSKSPKRETTDNTADKAKEEAAVQAKKQQKKATEEAEEKAAEQAQKVRAAEQEKEKAANRAQKQKEAATQVQKQKEAAEQARKKEAEREHMERKAAEQALKKAAEQSQKQAVEQAQKQKKAAKEAQKKAADARLQKWKQQEKKRKAEATKTGDLPVERVPKLSALLAMGGPEAEEYKKKVALAKLAMWKSNAGDRWQIVERTFDGLSISEVTKEELVTGISVEEAVETFKTNPEKFLAMHYWPGQQQENEFTYILRGATVGYEPKDIRTDGGGRFVIWRHMYNRLEAFKENILPVKSRDKYTDSMTFGSKKLHTKNKPLLPGRGMGVGDEANMELIGDFAQPSHVRQGACVGDCWLLSAIASLADFDWAVKRLFRKTVRPSAQDCPQDAPNQYVVTLWDLKTWKEVDVVVDERLPVRSDGSGYLLGAKPSKDGKFWVPYIEKAIASHCGGYDKLNGGNCTDAWPMMTGSRNQFVITKNSKTGKYKCGAKYNPQEQRWSDHSNSPHDSNPANWQVDWPAVGGGGDSERELNEDELFRKIVAWDENNYLIGAGTSGSSDKKATDGIVDNHAYSVIDSRKDICGTGIDLLLIRNPWGEGGDLKNGQFMRSGPGWDGNPAIKKELNPATEDDGLCWVTKEEFFRYFPTIYVCALNMTRLKDDTYVNDLIDGFRRQPKAAPKRAANPAPSNNEEIVPIYVNKTSDPGSLYKIVEETYSGGVVFSDIKSDVVKGVSIAKGVDEFRENPDKYLAIHYQNNMVTQGAPIQVHQFTYIYRNGTVGLEIDAAKSGKRIMLTNVLR